jgi:hypothetical protein
MAAFGLCVWVKPGTTGGPDRRRSTAARLLSGVEGSFPRATTAAMREVRFYALSNSSRSTFNRTRSSVTPAICEGSA